MRRYLLPIGILVAVVVILAAVKFSQISKLIGAGKAAEAAGPPPEVVGTAKATESNWESAVAAVGSVAAVRGVAVSNESPGTVTAIHFDSGDLVKAGQVLVELNVGVERAQLQSAEARKEAAALNAGRSRQLIENEAVSKAALDNDEATLKASQADVGALSAQIARKLVRAPFSGRIGIRQVNLGQYLNPGTPIAMLQAPGAVYVDFSLPQQRLADLKVGGPVRVTLSEGQNIQLDGTIAAIDPTVDAVTRTIKLRATLPNQKEQLYPGMFVNVTVLFPENQSRLVTAPATAVVHASYGDSVFVVEDKKDANGAVVNGPDGKPAKMARQQFVRLGESRGDFVALLDGVKAGQELVTAGAFKLRNGSGIIINNSIQATPSLAPKVENH